MKFELKNIKVNLTFSQETINFIADLFVDGIKVASCENIGCGGSSSYCPYPGKRDLLMEVEKYCKTLPKVTYGTMTWENSLEYQIDSIIDEYVNNKEKQKFVKKLNKDMNKGICYGSETQYTMISWKGRTVEDLLKFEQGKKVVANKVKELKARGENVLNTNIPTDVLEMV